jgi:DNA-binding MarR family transcriptional regulator
MPGDRLGNLLGVVALAVTDRVREATEQACRAGGAAAAVLVHLQAHPDDTVADLAATVGVGGSGGVRLVDRLVDQGLLHRIAGASGRTIAVRLTAEGLHTADRVLAARREAIRSVLAGLDPVEQDQLEALLSALTSSVSGKGATAHRACRLCDRAACRQSPGCPLDQPDRTA